MVSIVYSALVLLSFAHAVQSATTFVDVGINYEKDPYMKGFLAVRRLLMKNDPELFVGGHQFFAVRRPVFLGPPDKIIRIHLSGGSEADDQSIVAFAHDDMYAIGFTNRTGHWYCLANSRFIPGCIPLSFGENYAEILGPGGHNKLRLLPLGRQAAREAVSMLASHTGGPNESAAKQGLGRLIVMLAEAQRIRPINVNLDANWEGTIHMPPLVEKYCVNWGRMSKFLLEWSNSGRNDNAWGKSDRVGAQELKDEAGVSGPKDALRVVEGLLRPYPE